MRALLALVLLMCLAVPGVAEGAVTRQETIYLEGQPEEITETLYESKLGYSLWYEADSFSVQPAEDAAACDVFYPTDGSDMENCQLRIARKGAVESDADFQALMAEIAEDAFGSARTDALYDVELETLWPYQGVSATLEEQNSVRDLYGIHTPNGVYVIQLAYPLEAAEGWGARMKRLLSTISLPPMGARTDGFSLDFCSENGDAASRAEVVVDAEAEALLLSTGRDVEQFCLARAAYDSESGNFLPGEVLYETEKLAAGDVIRIQAYLDGALPNLAFGWTEQGAEKWLLMTSSGFDGSLLLIRAEAF